MSFTRLMAAALALLPVLACAQQEKPQPGPLDPGSPVPHTPYRSALEPYQSTQAEKETPDKRWKEANQRLMPLHKPADPPDNGKAAATHGHVHGGH